MANSGKNKTVASKKTTKKAATTKTKNATAKVVAGEKPAAKKTTVTKKKPASFSKNAAAKTTSKKTSVKKEAKRTPETSSNFSEFETLKLGKAEKLDSKIILRDVAREQPIEPIKTIKPAPKPAEKSQPIAQVAPASKPTAKQIKDREIANAIKNATKLPSTNTRRQKRSIFGDFGLKRVILATACVATAIFAVVYFVNLTSTDMSLKVAAMQSGIDAAYPSYVPRGFSLSDVTSGSGKVSMHFKNGDEEFGITEEVSNWDSEALLNNYIKSTYGNDYSVVREQGLTLYMGNNWEAWVNGGILYKLTIENGSLTKKQMKSIATSL
ncbi:MAG: hypothetical protein Q4F58_01775 [Candidatus Saccharibacteria bacterium]|nr:hypothetical protein [Candidatus Saccharibacteria bacterium]